MNSNIRERFHFSKIHELMNAVCSIQSYVTPKILCVQFKVNVTPKMLCVQFKVNVTPKMLCVQFKVM